MADNIVSSILLEGGPCNGRHIKIKGESAGGQVFALPIDENGRLTKDNAVAHAAYRLNADHPKVARFLNLLAFPNAKYVVEFVSGLNSFTQEWPFPASLGPPTCRVVVDEHDRIADPLDDTARIAVYVKATDGSPRYEHSRYEETSHELAKLKEESLFKAARDAAREFYRNPDYSIYSRQPTDEHKQVSIEVGHRKAMVDEGVAELIKALWELGLDTIGSCERLKSGKAYIAFNIYQDGAKAYEIISQAGIECELIEKAGSIRHKSGRKLATKHAHVKFQADDSGRVALALRTAKRV